MNPALIYITMLSILSISLMNSSFKLLYVVMFNTSILLKDILFTEEL